MAGISWKAAWFEAPNDQAVRRKRSAA